MKNKLKGCPICGGEAIMTQKKGVTVKTIIRCARGCMYITYQAPTEKASEKKAIEMWNKTGISEEE